MSDSVPKQIKPNSERRLLWASAAFYLLIAFEFFYMASPFAAYLYSVYGPGLDGLQNFGLSGWLLWFFLPHLVADTQSKLVNYAEPIGITLFLVGFIGFLIGAFQIYRAKLLRIGMVQGGVYQYIRHPQYTALIIASIGLLLIWPRFLVLFSTITMIFAYIVLARAEEKICAQNFNDYSAYQSRTGMFLPKFVPRIYIPNIQSKSIRIIAWVCSFVLVSAVATLIAFAIRNHAIKSLYTYKTDNGVYLSVTMLSNHDMARIAKTSQNHTDVNKLIEVHVRMNNLSIERVLAPPANSYYPDVQVPLF